MNWSRELRSFIRSLSALTKGKSKEELLVIKRKLQREYREKYRRVFVDSYVVPAHTKRLPMRRKVH